ncbi:MAG: response regulator transcription factor [Actinomycetota bacterium]|nr:response regulator transcription factor [Actinomycetota bacterium]
MSSIESFGSTKTPESSRYLSVDPETIGQLRILRVGDVELQVDGHRLVVRGRPVHLPHKEFVILCQLMNNAGRVVTHRNLLDNAWGSDRAGVQNCLGVHIRRLRTKIESDADKPTRIRTVRGVGYIFDLPQDR